MIKGLLRNLVNSRSLRTFGAVSECIGLRNLGREALNPKP